MNRVITTYINIVPVFKSTENDRKTMKIEQKLTKFWPHFLWKLSQDFLYLECFVLFCFVFFVIICYYYYLFCFVFKNQKQNTKKKKKETKKKRIAKLK